MLERVEGLLALQLNAFWGTFHHVGGQVLRLWNTQGLPEASPFWTTEIPILLNEIIRDLDQIFSKQRKTQSKTDQRFNQFCENIGSSFEEIAQGDTPAMESSF